MSKGSNRLGPLPPLGWGKTRAKPMVKRRFSRQKRGVLPSFYRASAIGPQKPADHWGLHPTHLPIFGDLRGGLVSPILPFLPSCGRAGMRRWGGGGEVAGPRVGLSRGPGAGVGRGVGHPISILFTYF
jgi:hypothetical protein